ncbi:VirD4-like conjugal transfer protein, CD1115 family [Pseudolactococcus laudensis]|jgi:type IV secretion system protein VirD4|uniref:VirD4-like conjugal transfer protein, CD1115 family n=1 Tax=Pseudolactococcus laudensis TaxID=1494461 RepID=UPI001D75E3FA|nr:type IV secretory system conjugative DNA transfer family protein [Bacilli bacterium]
MITERKRKKFLPYFLLSIVFFYLFHCLFVFYQKAPDLSSSTDVLGIAKFDWLINNFTYKVFLNIHFTSFSILTGLVGVVIALMAFLRVSDTGVYRHGEEQGSARFATVKELLSFRDKEPENNMIFTKNGQMGLFNKRLPYPKQLNKNSLVVGIPGDGKTFTYVKPNIMQENSSFVITDPKGLLVREVGSMLENDGYTIKVFDLVNLTNSDTFNVFNYMKSELDIDRVSEAIVDGTKKSDKQGEDFWAQAELLLMRSLLGYLYFDSQISGYTPNLSNVSDMLRNIQRIDKKKPSPVEKMFEALDKELPDNYACKQWELFNNNFQSETRTSVLAVASARYAVFDHKEVKTLIERDTMEMDKWNIEKTAVFITIPETNKAFNFLASLMFAMMFDVLTHQADDMLQGLIHQDKELLHIQFIIDEFANIGKIPNFNEVLASIRSREMSAKIIIQAISQLQAMYHNDWKTIINNCATILYLGTQDKETMEYFSMRSGKQTINVKNRSVSRGRNGSMSESNQIQMRPLMTPDEIARIGVDEALLFIAKQNVLKDKKASVFDHPKAKELANHHTDDNWYQYKRYMTDIAEWQSNVDESQLKTYYDFDVSSVEHSA